MASSACPKVNSVSNAPACRAMRALLAGLIWTLLHCADAACPQAPVSPYQRYVLHRLQICAFKRSKCNASQYLYKPMDYYISLYIRLYDQGTGPYTFTVKVPNNCQKTDCDYYLAIKPNGNDSTYTDFYIEGAASGYVAVGLSSSGGMVRMDKLPRCAIWV